MHRKVVAAFAVVLALGIASCGGSSEETLTRAQVVSRLETACRQAQQRSEQVARRLREPDSFFTAILAGQRQLSRDLEAIEAGDEVTDQVDALKSGLAERTDLIASVVDASRAERQRAMSAIEERANAATRRIDAAFRRLGVRGCF